MSNLNLPSRRDIRRKPKRAFRIFIVFAIVGILAAGFALNNKALIRSWVDTASGADYTGSGNGEATIVIDKGDIGAEVAKKLVQAGVTKDIAVTLRAMEAIDPTFFPGEYVLPKHIPSDSAIRYLTDPTNMRLNRVTVREGLRLTDVFKLLSKSSSLPESEFISAAKNLSKFGIPKVAPSLEGYLFPATYDFAPSLNAEEMLQIMVTRTKEQLIGDGVYKSHWHEVLTLASIVQREVRNTDDFYKASRVFKNRIIAGMPLQSDATVSYGVSGSTFTTSASDRLNPNDYNTYLYPGLPIGPISGAGALAIDAVLNPANGPWLFFCTIDLKTGETVFSETLGEHEIAVAKWLKWLKENPDWNE